jgi:hypothetical protein
MKMLALAAAVAFAAAAQAQQAPPVRLVRVPESGIQPQAATDAKGTLHLLYFKGDPKAGDLFYTTRAADAVEFSAPLHVNSQPGSAIAIGNDRGGQLALGRDGRIHVAWNGSPTAAPKAPKNPAMAADAPANGTPMLYARLADSRAAFEPQRNLMTRSVALDGGGSVAADASGNVVVVWHGLPLADAAGASGETFRRVLLARSTDDGATFASEVPISADGLGACGCCGLKVFAAADGSINILFRAATASVNRDTVLLRSTDRGTTFTATTVDTWPLNSCPMTTAAMANGPGGALLLAYQTREQIFLTRRPGDADRLAPAASPPGNAAGRKYPAVAVSPSGQILFAWTEGMSWDRGGTVHWQVFDPDLKPIAGASGSRGGVPAWSLVAAAAGPDGTFFVIY